MLLCQSLNDACSVARLTLGNIDTGEPQL